MGWVLIDNPEPNPTRLDLKFDFLTRTQSNWTKRPIQTGWFGLGWSVWLVRISFCPVLATTNKQKCVKEKIGGRCEVTHKLATFIDSRGILNDNCLILSMGCSLHWKEQFKPLNATLDYCNFSVYDTKSTNSPWR